MPYERSVAAFERAKRVIAGGVNSPARAFRAVGGTPVFIESAKGATLTDIDGRTYIDYVLSWGPMIVGHAHPDVVAAIQAAVERGTSYGAPTEAESDLAELITERMPSIERLRFVSSGTEATMSAVRLARGFTGRDLIVKFEGCYHGHGDAFLIAAGSSALTNGHPDSPGVTKAVAHDSLIVPYNDLSAVEALFAAHPGAIAAAIVEPYVGNMGLVLPKPGFLAGLREITDRDGALLIFDEVMTGFRVARGGAQERENVVPDLTTLGKIVGGGMPVGAFGGRAEVMDRLSPVGPVFQAGTLSGNPVAMAAGAATLRLLDAQAYRTLDDLAERWTGGLDAVLRKHGVPHTVSRRGAMVGFFFRAEPVCDLTDARTADTALFARFFHEMLDRGVYLPCSQFEAAFLSTAHTEADIERTVAAADEALEAIFARAG